MTVDEVIEKFQKDKILITEQGKIVLAPKYYPKTLKTSKDQEFNTLLDAYADSYPKSIKSGGRLIRRSPNSLRAKLQAFVNKRKDIPFDIILQAVKHYIKEAKQRNYEYCISSDYLILKNGSSELESICDLALEGGLKAQGADNYVESLN